MRTRNAVVFDYFLQPPHVVHHQEIEHVVNRPDLKIIDHQHAAGFQARVEVKVLQVWKWVTMRAIDQCKLYRLSKLIARQS